MEEQNNEIKKQIDEIISQNKDEIESLNDNGELDSESLERVTGGGWGCTDKGCNKDVYQQPTQ
jgi:hypothetical protein